jgi:D-glycerate 3-kinase
MDEMTQAVEGSDFREALSQLGLAPELHSQNRSLYLALGQWIVRQAQASEGAFVLGVSGCQGSGKSTLSKLLSVLLEAVGLKTAVFSIDDFYLGRRSRQEKAKRVHRLFETRGVPGTHDFERGIECLRRLKSGHFKDMKIPRFNKATDDLYDESQWTVLRAPIKVAIFEGWCVGCPALPRITLEQSPNKLEACEDRDARWRGHVQEMLSGPYKEWFDFIDRLLFLKAPSWEIVADWRGDQEAKLRARCIRDGDNDCGVMDSRTLQRFLAHYQRWTVHMLDSLGQSADWVLSLDERRGVLRSVCRES